MNSQLFVASTVTQSKDISALLPGELGIYAINADTARLENATPLLKTEKFLIAVGKKSGTVVNSRDIDAITATGLKGVRKRNFEFKKIVYAEPVKNVFNLTTDYLGRRVDDEFDIRIQIDNAFGGYFGIERFNKTYAVQGIYATAGALYRALAAEINRDEDLFLDSAVGSDSGLLITARTDYVLNIAFQIVQSDPTAFSTVNTRVEEQNEPSTGAGTVTQLTALAAKWSYWNGGFYSAIRLFNNTEEDQTIPTTGSDQYYLKYTNRNQVDESQTEAAFNVFQELVVAVPAGTDMTYFISTCEALLGAKIETTPSFLL